MLRDRGIVRLSEFTAAGTTTATVGRMRNNGGVIRLTPGRSQLPDAPLDANHGLTESAKRVPEGVDCLVSVLAIHELTDPLLRPGWLVIGKNGWSPQDQNPPLRIIRIADSLLSRNVETVVIAGAAVRVFGVAKTIAYCFRHRRSVGQSVALKGLQEALRQRKATPPETAQAAARGSVATIVSPYLEALLQVARKVRNICTPVRARPFRVCKENEPNYQSLEFDGNPFVRAIAAIFIRRDTTISKEIPAVMTTDFGNDEARLQQRDAFVRDVSHAPGFVSEVIRTLAEFLMPAAPIASGRILPSKDNRL